MLKRSIRGIYWMLGLGALWFIPAVANAQVTVKSVKVTESGPFYTAVWCDTSLPCSLTGGLAIWDLGGGITLNGGNTLVLTQTGAFGPNGFGNFDTSDRAQLAFLKECTVLFPCQTTVEINGTVVYTGPPLAGDALNVHNTDLVDNGSVPNSINEASKWVPVVTNPNYTLSLGYADNEHTATCPTQGCFPSPFFASGVTHFLGAGINTISGFCPTNCYDGGALLITGVGAPFTGCTVTQGGWGAVPHGNNPAAFLAAHFPAAPGVTIGLGYPNNLLVAPFWLNFSSALAVQNFLPQGGTPGALSASAPNPTSGTSAGVFAGQVLALTLNVQLQGFGSLVLSGTGTSFDGKTVNDVLAAANTAISGGALPTGFTYSSLNDLVDKLNNAFDGCVATGWATGHLH